jgi:hypothetical protein
VVYGGADCDRCPRTFWRNVRTAFNLRFIISGIQYFTNIDFKERIVSKDSVCLYLARSVESNCVGAELNSLLLGILIHRGN